MAAITNRIVDLLVLLLIFVLMVCGFILYAVLFPFFRIKLFLKLFFVVAGFSLLLAVAGWFLIMADATKEREGPLVETVFIVERGSTLTRVSQLLHNLGIIESPLQFQILAALRGESTKIKAGRYRFSSRMAVADILGSLSRGTTYNNSVVITEGATSWQIASIMRAKLDMDSSEIIGLINDSVFAKSLGVEATSLEGYLFPDTYWIPWNASSEAALRQMVNRFMEVYSRVHKVNDLTKKYTRHELVTMASIIEAEAVIKEEREIISGVFYNRLRKRMPLGADPTVCYAFRKTGPQLTKSDLSRDHPYNTRVRRGLPPGPIGSPGEASLRAAISPASTPFLYFVARYDGTNGHYFTTTYEEHLVMKRLAEETLQRRKVSGDLSATNKSTN